MLSVVTSSTVAKPPTLGVQGMLRLGVVLPSVNTVVESWFNRVLPECASLHTSRMMLTNPVTKETLKQMDHEEGLPSALRLASCRPHVIAYGCTASSIVQGPAYDQHLKKTFQEATGIPCFTAVHAIEEALRQLGAHTICLASPYTAAIDHAEKAYFESLGFQVAGTANLGISDGFELASPSANDIFNLALRAWKADADALLISCLNMNSHVVVQRLERELGCPVVTSTTATLWMLLRTAGIPVHMSGYGRLLDRDITEI